VAGRSQRKEILADHKRVGKRLVPPFFTHFGPLHEVPWVRFVLPEVLWIALLHDRYGDRAAVEKLTSLTRKARSLASLSPPPIFGATSSFLVLDGAQKDRLRAMLSEDGELPSIQAALDPLVALYPRCPLSFLWTHVPDGGASRDERLSLLRRVVRVLYDRSARFTVMTQATFIWFCFDSGRLKVFEGLALAQFPKVEDYPATELSRRIASSIRSAVLMFFGKEPPEKEWTDYFWNRGLEIDTCVFRGLHEPKEPA
jgi:hypothetical protein